MTWIVDAVMRVRSRVPHPRGRRLKLPLIVGLAIGVFLVSQSVIGGIIEAILAAIFIDCMALIGIGALEGKGKSCEEESKTGVPFELVASGEVEDQSCKMWRKVQKCPHIPGAVMHRMVTQIAPTDRKKPCFVIVTAYIERDDGQIELRDSVSSYIPREWTISL